jgi:hypothetical protein
LRKQGAQVDVVEAYETIIPKASRSFLERPLDERPLDMVVFTSSATVLNLAEMMAPNADAAREAVRVEALQQELGRSPADAEQISEACERDRAGGRALLHEQTLRLLVRRRAHRVAVADLDEAAERVYNFLHTLTLEVQMLARACGKTNIHSLEPEDLCALTTEAAAMARVPLAGTTYIPGVTEERTLNEIKKLVERQHQDDVDDGQNTTTPLHAAGD